MRPNPELIGQSAAMERLRRMIAKARGKTSSVLILGESGTGKELVARAIHRDPGKPFVAVDCAALPPTLVESELFGHTQGAFTGASKEKIGLIQAADGGTLFLDEVGELPLEMQAKLLRTLQQREVRPVGGLKAKPVDVRVIAATNRELEREVRDGKFRKDLYFRLAVIVVRVPPLRERRSDIPILAKTFVQQNADAGYDGRISPEALERLMRYDWPGNVRELENAMERAVAMNTNGPIRKEDLPTTIQSAMAAAASADAGSLAAMERQAIVEALRKANDNKMEAAKLLGIGKTTLYRKLREFEAD